MSRKTRQRCLLEGSRPKASSKIKYKTLNARAWVFPLVLMAAIQYSPNVMALGGTTTVLPLQRIPQNQWPSLRDDLSFQNMDLAISRQLKRFSQKPMGGFIQMGSDKYPKSQMVESLHILREEVNSAKHCLEDSTGDSQSLSCWTQLDLQMKKKFVLYRPQSDGSSPEQAKGKALFTAYYTPLLEGRGSYSQDFPHAIHQIPSDPKLKSTPRVGIDFDGRLRGTGSDLFYVKDLFDLYLMHIEGGGKITLGPSQNGESYYLSYAGTNGQSWRFISKYMKEKGMISDLSVESQRRYLDAHPEKWREIYGYCPSYVYFKVTSTPPLGSDSVPLTDNRSMATDRTIYSEKGLIGFVSAKRPTEDGKWKASNSETIGDRRTESQGKLPFRTFSRFFLDQDTGGAIRGRLRADLYFGEGDYAGEVAHSLKNYGDMYFLMLRR